ncbi:MAG: tRNA pseudouridine(38-40) synthase TruA [Desulfobacteraceae bacterium]|nr:tRNA pseudouridine(38-40) synthase TruA [Desulfobacteraceae bacterium]
MDNNFKLTIEYDGTNYHGWQRQVNERTIQKEIEKAIEKMTREKIILTASGRTDAGVHAIGQVANFKSNTRIGAQDLQNGLNSILPNDIVIHKCEAVDQNFHARYDAKSKRYRYTIINRARPNAIGRQYVWWIKSPLNIEAMREAILLILGEHDFKAFEGAGSPRSHTVRHIHQATLEPDGTGKLRIEIEANGFLRFMVRNIVGTLAMVGAGKLAADDIALILNSKDRKYAGATCPAQGLCLMQVHY